MIEFRTKTGDTFIGLWLGGSKGNIVLACGIPQYLDKYHPFVQQVSRLGYNLFVPRYHGTYESGGKFTIINAALAIDECIKLVRAGQSLELYGNETVSWNNNIPIFLIGFSFGALPALLSAQEVDKLVLSCPFVNIKYHQNNTQGEDVSSTFSFIERAYTNLYRINSENVLKELSGIKPPTSKKALTILKGLDDKSIPVAEISDLISLYQGSILIEKEGGHTINMSDELFLRIFNTNE